MTLAQNEERKATIDWIEEGKVWSGKDGTEMKEHKVAFKNGEIPVFNYPANKVYPFAKGDVVTYLLSERINPVDKKIIQNGKQMKKVEEQPPAQTSSPQKNVPLTQQQSIALSVASKLGFETVTSDAWQDSLKIKAKKTDCKEGEEIEQATLRLQSELQSSLLTSIGQVTIAYYNLLTTKPQENANQN
tara:strand:- start:1994 stop:2557 length:564 start_codon:yes stop_codon:yes gene_type:complete